LFIGFSALKAQLTHTHSGSGIGGHGCRSARGCKKIEDAEMATGDVGNVHSGEPRFATPRRRYVRIAPQILRAERWAGAKDSHIFGVKRKGFLVEPELPKLATVRGNTLETHHRSACAKITKAERGGNKTVNVDNVSSRLAESLSWQFAKLPTNALSDMQPSTQKQQ